MKYNHLRLLRSLMDQGKSQRKIVEYFQGEGYSEEEAINEISSYEQEKRASSDLKKLPETEFTLEKTPERIPKKSFLPIQVIIALLVVIMTLLLIATAVLIL